MLDFCEKCKNKDIRLLQDNFNNLYTTMNRVADALEIDEPDWEKRVKKINEWAKEIVRKRTEIKAKRPPIKKEA